MTPDRQKVHLAGTMTGVGVRILLPFEELFGDIKCLIVEPGGTLEGHRALAIAHAARGTHDVEVPAYVEDPTPNQILSDWERALRLAHDDTEAYEQSKEAWIETAGSPHLRLGFARGYAMQEQYLRERAAVDFPGFDALVDPPGAVGQHKESPTAVALEVLSCVEAELDMKGVACARAEILGLVRGPVWASRAHVGQAVVVRGWLGRHDVWIPV